MNIRELQSRLIALGYDLGPSGADGDFGRRTIAAVTKFQADRKLDIQYPGTVGPKTLAALGMTTEQSSPPWINESRKYLGMHEVTNAKTIDKLLKFDTSETPWCGAFVGMVIGKTIPTAVLPKNPLWARDWLKFGVKVSGVHEGAIAVFARGSGGHVGFVVGHDKTALHILGGNQSNRVSVARVAKNRLLGYTWPKAYEIPTTALPITTIAGTLSHNEA